MHQNSEKVLAGDVQVKLFGPAGGSRTLTGAFAPQGINQWLVETEIHLFSQSNIIVAGAKRDPEEAEHISKT